MKILPIIIVVQVMVLVCVAVATPIDVFRSKKKVDEGEDYACHSSMWGGSKICGTHKTNPKVHARRTINAVAALDIISIILSLIVLLLCVYLIGKPIIGDAMIAAMVGIIAFLTMMAGSFQGHKYSALFIKHEEVRRDAISEHQKLCSNFGLMVTAWILQLINVVFMFLA